MLKNTIPSELRSIPFAALTIGSIVQVKRLFYSKSFPQGKPLDYIGTVVELGYEHDEDFNVHVSTNGGATMAFNYSELKVISLK